jgi:hypothetical protein
MKLLGGIRESLDQGVFVANLSALVDGVLLGCLDLFGSGILLASDLLPQIVSYS